MVARRLRSAACVLVLTFSFWSCSKERKGSAADTASYPIRGEVTAIDTTSSMITIAHHEIPGLMQAMTMPFKAKNPLLCKTVAIGDSVEGNLVASKREIYLDTLTVVRRNPIPRQ